MKYYSEETVNKMLAYLAVSRYFPIVSTYPSIEIPEPHGDLIARTWLDDYASEFITEKDRRIGTYDWVEDMIEEAPTVIEASEVKE